MASSNTQPSSRRRFLKRAAIVLGGTVVTAYLGRNTIRRFSAQTAESLDLPSILTNFDPEFWFEVKPDNTVLMKSPKVEMGQGIFTGFALLAAEELEIPFERVRVEHATTRNGAIDVLGTNGSSSTLSMHKSIREVAATLREMLRLAAAKKWGVAVENVKNTEGVFSTGDKRMTYAEVVATTQEWKIPKTPKLKPASDWQQIGRSVQRIDIPTKVMGTAQYTIDAKMPDMLYAVRVQSPYINGTIASIDVSEAEKSPNVVKVIREKELVAVVAKSRFAAESAAQKVKIEWNVPKKWQQSDIEKQMTVGNGTRVNLQDDGNAEKIVTQPNGRLYRQEYRTPMAVHAPMEPHGTLAKVDNDQATIIAGTQKPGLLVYEISNAVDVKMKNVDIQTPFLGGGFGGKMFISNALETAQIAKIVGKPVKMIATREQEFQNSKYRPNTHHVLSAKIGEGNKIEAIVHNQATSDMTFHNYYKPLSGVNLAMMGGDFISAGHGGLIYYDNIPNISSSMWHNDMPYEVVFWRGVGVFDNAFAMESFFNELAHETGKDPIAMRLELLSDKGELNPRFKKVLEAARNKGGWLTPKPVGIGRGMAIANDRKSIAATVVEVAIENGQIRVKKATQILDAGKAVNPEGIKQQIESCTMMGISAALYEEVKIEDSQISASNYHAYPMATLADTPIIETVILENTTEIYGAGEPSIAPVAPAIAAALFDLTGKRLRNLPFKLG
jgi:isoquinoline 1-oxidoreductase subunit beta